MEQVNHIRKNKRYLELRSRITRLIREFFWSENFLEAEAPVLIGVPGQEPYLSPMRLEVRDERGISTRMYLHTSPEYVMKKMLAAGFGDIFSICKCFRNQESFGGWHHPEFTMLEWYRKERDFYGLMDDLDSLMNFILNGISLNPNICAGIGGLKSDMKFKRIHMRDLWLECIGIDLNDYLDTPSLRGLCAKLNLESAGLDSYCDLFYKIFLNKIEGRLIEPVIVHHYPAQMAALAKLSDADKRYAERFEVYMNGIEIANAFTELTDAKEQLKRLKEERVLREKMGKEVYDIDMEFVGAVGEMPECAGIALGVDRLVMVLLGRNDINDVIVLPAAKWARLDVDC